MTIVILIAIVALSAAAAAVTGDLLETKWPTWSKVAVPTVAAVLTLLGSQISDRIERHLSEPKVTVTTTRKDGEINIAVRTDGEVNRISISYPVNGLINNVIPFDLSDAVPVMTRVFGPSTQDAVQNKLEAIADPLKSDVQLSYKIFYTPGRSAVGEIVGLSTDLHSASQEPSSKTARKPGLFALSSLCSAVAIGPISTAVNRHVAGSNPARGANLSSEFRTF